MHRRSSGDTVNLGVIGLGDHSDLSHLRYVADMAELCTVTALADLNPERVKHANATYGFGAEEFTDGQELLEDGDVDAVLIMTPDRFHTPQLVAGIALGKHVFCEKPLAQDKAELGALEVTFDSAERQGLELTTCHPRRFDPPFITVKNYLADPDRLRRDFGARGELGQVTAFLFNFNYHRPSKQGLHTSLMFDHLNHEVDAMHFLFGVSDIAAATKHYDSATEFRVTGKRQDGIAFDFTGARHRDESIYPEDMCIAFENGELRVDLHTATASLRIGDAVYERHSPAYKTAYAERFAETNRHFLHSVLGLAAPYISPRELLINTRAAIDLHHQPSAARII
ncbi:MAG TPA: Gfo/Idh/MocA family oxidoreductase [Candidatus Saccharimonadales bacterium]|nr:Gfo/Idh/MocA family oxidoreductase [Candidatus Saccharimonadales bacterium]